MGTKLTGAGPLSKESAPYVEPPPAKRARTIQEPEKTVVQEPEEFVWNPRGLVKGVITRFPTFIEASGAKLTNLYWFLKAPRHERWWISELDITREPKFWEIILKANAWLEDEQLDEALMELSSRLASDPSAYQNYYVFPTAFMQTLSMWTYEDMETLPEKLIQFLNAKPPISDYEGFVSVLNIPTENNRWVGCHWVAIKADFKTRCITVYDCNKSLKETHIDPVLERIRKAVPKMLILGGFPSLASGEDAWRYVYYEGLPQNQSGNDCGVFSFKFVEASLLKDMDMFLRICDDKVTSMREKMAADIYSNGERINEPEDD